MVYLFWSTTLLLVGCGTPTVHELPTYMIDQDQVAATVEALSLKQGNLSYPVRLMARHGLVRFLTTGTET